MPRNPHPNPYPRLPARAGAAGGAASARLLPAVMAETWIAVEEAEAGAVPPVCARSGRRCITRYRREVTDVPDWVEWLLWRQAWPLVPLLEGRCQPIVLPLLPAAHRRSRLLGAVRDASLGLAVALLVLALLLAGWPAAAHALRVVAVGAVAAHLAAGVAGRLVTVDCRLDTTGRWVRMSRVHPTFAAEVARRCRRPDVAPTLPAPPLPHLRDALRASGRRSEPV